MGSWAFTTNSIPDLTGKTYIVTGGNSGIGYETSKHIALHGGHVIIATHAQKSDAPMPADEVDGPGAVAKIKEHDSNAKVEYMECDCSSFRSIRSLAEAIISRGDPVHCLVNNAGLQTPPDAKTEDGFEITMGINFFSHFYLTQLLLPVLKQSAPSRIVWVSSPTETLGYTDWDDIRCAKRETTFQTYGTSKLWMLMMGMEFNDRLKGTGVESFACQPGMARTDIFRKADSSKPASVATDWAQYLAGQSAESGALALLYCATAPELDGKGGTYYGPMYVGANPLNLLNTHQCSPGNSEAKDPEVRKKLYDEVMKVVNDTAGKIGDKVEDAGVKGSTAAASVDSQAAAISKLASAMAGTHIAQGSMAAEGEEAGGINKAAAGVQHASVAEAPAGAAS